MFFLHYNNYSSFILNRYINKYIFYYNFYFLLTIFGNKKKKFIIKNKKTNKIISMKTKYDFFYNNIYKLYSFFIKTIKTIIKEYNLLLVDNQLNTNKIYSFLNKSTFFIPKYFLKTNNFLFWHCFNNDKLIEILMNLIMKDGKKYSVYKIIYRSLFFIKKTSGLQPIIFLKKLLLRRRLLFDIKTINLRKRIIQIPKLLAIKRQCAKTLKFIIRSLNIQKLKMNKNDSFYKKFSYLLINNLYNNRYLKKLLKKYKSLVKKNIHIIKKESFLSKYVREVKNIRKKRLFKVKFKSKTAKMKYLFKRNRTIGVVKRRIDFKKKFLLNRYNINLVSRCKLKTKWH